MKTRKKNLLSFLNKSGLFKDDDFKGLGPLTIFAPTTIARATSTWR